jgi:topoisomerase IA-like protein
VIDFILEMAKVTDVTIDAETLYKQPEDEGEPAKKAAAKKPAAKKAAAKKSAAKKSCRQKASRQKSRRQESRRQEISRPINCATGPFGASAAVVALAGLCCHAGSRVGLTHQP